MNASPVKLNTPEAIPAALTSALQAHDALLKSSIWTETLIQDGPLATIADALSEHLRGQRIHGYHCTREPHSGYFAEHGLRATDLKEHQRWFLDSLGHHFTADERAYMERQWDAYFDVGQQRSRQGKVWACLTPELCVSTGTEWFFKAFGGEAIHMPLAEESSALVKLMHLGEPVVVEISLPGDQISTYCDMAWCALSHYHRKLNPDAVPMESEALIRRSVPPTDVLAVTPAVDFREARLGIQTL